MTAKTAKDDRRGFGNLGASIEMPTLTIPCNCSCSWSVVQPGPGMACISRRSYPNRACIVRHPVASVPAQRGASWLEG